MTIRYLDFEGGNDANNGTTFALRKKTLSSATATQGDTVRVMASPDPTSLGQSATFTSGSDTITLANAVTANIDTCETAWTASANVTATAQSAIQREGTNAASLVVAGAFTTGLIAYHALGTLDLSAYQQVSFLIRQSGLYGNLAANTLSLQLCSDAAGTVPVHSFTLPLLGDGVWTALVFDTAAALGSSIQSIALYALLDPGSLTIAIDNVIACKAASAADSLTHQSLISKNTGSEPWMAIDSINGTTIKLAGGYQATASRSGFTPYYWGTTEAVTIYKRETIPLSAYQSVYAGCAIEGGWDRTAMATQSGKTFVRAINPNIASSSNALFSALTTANGSLNNWYSVNAINKGMDFYQGWTLGEIGAIACGSGMMLYQTAWAEAISDVPRNFIHCANAIRTAGSPGNGDTRLRIDHLWGIYNGSAQYIALADESSSVSCRSLTLLDCDIQQFFAAFGNQYATKGIFDHAIFSNCTFANLNRFAYTTAADIQLIGCPAVSIAGLTDSVVAQTRIGGDAAQNKTTFGLYRGNGTVESSTEQRHTASDFAWKVTSIGNATFFDPISFPIAKIACPANELRTVKLWVYRGDANAIFRLRIKGGSLAGIDQDITAVLPAGTATWLQLALEFTPTQEGVAEVFAEGGGGIGSTLWIDDLEVL